MGKVGQTLHRVWRCRGADGSTGRRRTVERHSFRLRWSDSTMRISRLCCWSNIRSSIGLARSGGKYLLMRHAPPVPRPLRQQEIKFFRENAKLLLLSVLTQRQKAFLHLREDIDQKILIGLDLLRYNQPYLFRTICAQTNGSLWRYVRRFRSSKSKKC